MTYDDIATAFLIPPDEPIAAPALPDTPARRLRDAVEVIATQGWWSRTAADRVTALGLGFFDGYVWGRAAALGNPTPAVVVATFGVFEPNLLTAVYEAGRAGASRQDVLAAREAGAIESLGALVHDRAAATVADPLLDALEHIDGMGRPLFSALRALPVPAAPAGRLWRAAELVREHRGDGHLAACVAAGLDACTTNVLTELWLGYTPGEYSGTRGFGAEALGTALAGLAARGWVDQDRLTVDGQLGRDAIEAATDASQRALLERLGVQLESVIDAAEMISASILAARAAPYDPRKRAAG